MNIYKFFDHFGVALFTLLAIDALYDIVRGHADWRIWFRFLFGISGIIVDGYLVFFY